MADPARVTQQYVETAISEDSEPRYARVTQQHVEVALETSIHVVPEGGNIERDQTIVLSSSPDIYSLYYTTDGSTPDDTDTEYVVPIGVRIRGSFTLKAIAYLDSAPHYPVLTEDFVVADVDPVAEVVVREVTRDAAILTCTVTDFGTEETFTVSFEYGTTTDYDIETVSKSMTYSDQYTGVPDSSVDNKLSVSLTDLVDNTTYYVRVKITNGVDTWYTTSSFVTGALERDALPDWVEQNKGQGVWDFTEQPNKWGYLNNPRWMKPAGAPVSYDGREDEEPQVWDSTLTKSSAGSFKAHIPCGHWHKVSSVPAPLGSVNIFGVFDTPDTGGENTLWGVEFDFTREALSPHGHYEAVGKSIEGIEFDYLARQLLVIEGSGASGKILRISYDNFSNTVTRHYLAIDYKDVFSEYDIGGSHRNLFRDDSSNIFVYSSTHRIIRLGANYQKEATGYTGTCSYAPTDGNLYVVEYIPILYNFWNSPPDGGSNTYFHYIPDQTTDSPITPWGSGGDPYLSAARGTHNRVFLYAGQIWFDCHATPYTEIKLLNRTDFARTSVIRGAEQFKGAYPADPYIFTARNGLNDWSINKINYDTGDVISSHTAVGSAHASGTTIVYESYALFCCDTGIYSCDVETFTIAEYHTGQGGYGELIPLKNRYFAAAKTNTISVFYLNEDGTLRHVDSITLSDYGPEAGSIKGQSLISTIQLEGYS